MLVAYGADVTAVDKEFNSALHFAAEGGYGMICKYLGQRGTYASFVTFTGGVAMKRFCLSYFDDHKYLTLSGSVLYCTKNIHVNYLMIEH